MPNPDEHRLTIRFTGEEYAALLLKSGGQPMAPFVRELALRRLSERRAKPIRTPLKDYVALARVLAKLGTSPLVETFQRVSQDLQDGGTPVSLGAEQSLDAIAGALAEINTLLMGALIDTTVVKGLPGLAEKSLEIMVGAAEANREEQPYFASPITLQSQCKRLGGEALDRVGRSAKTNLIAFTDGGGNVRRLTRELGATEDPITDWFHLSMRIRHVEAVASAFRATTRPMEASRTSLIRKVERLRWRRWQGKSRGIWRTRSELTMDLRTHRGDPDQAGWKRSGSKLRQSIDKFEDYVTSSKTRLIDYRARQSSGRRVSRSLVEGAADFIVNALMGRKQHMRWSSQGAFQILQARAADINGLLESQFLAA